MNLLFVADPVETFNQKKDSTLAMMREATRRGFGVWACEPRHLQWTGGGAHAGGVRARCRHLKVVDGTSPWFVEIAQTERVLRDFDAVLMRKDPPFDAEYFNATHMLEQAEREGARVFNRPRALRDHPEKLAILEWPALIPSTLVSRDVAALRAFALAQRDVIVKPLDGMGGTGVFRLRSDHAPDANLNVTLEMLTDHGRHTIMAQRFVPEISAGDKRVILIDGQPVPWTLARIPQHGDTRGNLAAGGLGVAQPLGEAEAAIAARIGPELAARGLLLVGIDVIGDRLTEINVTSPTCFVEIHQQSGFDVAAMFIDALCARLRAPAAHD